MKRVVLVCLALAAAAAAPAVAQNPPAGGAARPTAPAATGPLKIGYVSSQQILQRTPGFAAAESTFNREVQGFRDEVQRLSQQLDSATQAYDQQSIAMSPTVKQQRVEQLRQMQSKLQQRTDSLQQRAQLREQELLQPIRARVNSIIQGLRAEGNFAYIFDTDAPGNPIVAADPAFDLTARVLQRLQSAQ
jgi:outer membrane protein